MMLVIAVHTHSWCAKDISVLTNLMSYRYSPLNPCVLHYSKVVDKGVLGGAIATPKFLVNIIC